MTAGRRATKERGNPAGHSAPTPRVAANDGGSPLQAWVAAGKPQPIPFEVVAHARQFLAGIVLRHGEWALPLFERLDEECVALERQRSSLDRVRAIAGRA